MKTACNFKQTLNENDVSLRRERVEAIQINLGKLCNQVCTHCHVDAGPHKKKENMDEAVAKKMVDLILATEGIKSVDLTGGAPEMNPYFKYVVEKLRAANIKVIDRCNLTILMEDGYEWVAPFLKEHSVDVVASLPCYDVDNVDEQRGDGVFEASMKALKLLNSLGYGSEDSNLSLNLVYNPNGSFLAPDQKTLEAQYKEKLFDKFGIKFNSLYALNNVPIKRYLYQLVKKKYDEYMKLLLDNFNASSVAGLMCKNTLSLSWNGEVFDCDFNQALEMHSSPKKTIFDVKNFHEFDGFEVKTANHCYACTAGAGSSCYGATE